MGDRDTLMNNDIIKGLYRRLISPGVPAVTGPAVPVLPSLEGDISCTHSL
jgi:hypothetical protein